MLRQLNVLVLLFLPVLMLPGPCFAQQKKGAAKKSPTDSFVTGAPFTFDQVFRFIQENVIPPRRQKEAIQNRGVDFAPLPDLLEKLRAVGASDDMIELISWRGKPLPPKVVKPAPPKTGGVDITCAPLECDVSIGGVSKGSTANGTLRITGIQLGSATVDLKRAGYIGAQSAVMIEAGKVASLSVTLAPDRATKEAFGEQLFKKMVQALGGDAAIRDSASIQAQGAATIWARDGSNARWNILVRNRPERALFQAAGAGSVLYEVAFIGSQFKTSKSLKGGEALELPANFGLVRDHQISGLIALLSSPKFKMLSLSDTKVPGQDLTLAAEASAEKISISLDNDSRPAEVKFSDATGLGSQIVSYSDYVQKGKTFYPQTTEIRPDSKLHGILVHFDTVELNPKLKDTDYNLRGKPLAR